MRTLKSLAQSAMLGVESDPGAFLAAACTGIGELGGFVPFKIEDSEAACPAEARLEMPGKAAALLKRILAGEFEETLLEFLQLAAGRGLAAPPETIPALLGLGKRELRPLVLAVSGERGRWLARSNPAWAFALARQPEEAWEQGTHAERVIALQAMRADQPEQARQWVQSTWEQDAPEDRAAFLETFSTGLDIEDELFLETCLDDKRKEVREAARRLLVHLEASRLVQRMWARLRPLIRLRSKLLGGEKLEVTLPETLDAAAKRDGIGGAPLRKKMGEKANWLAQMLALTPPALWNREFDKTPEKLIAAALDCEWKEPILFGWQLAAQNVGDIAWAEAIAAAWVTTEACSFLDANELDGIFLLMRPEKVEALLSASIKPMIGELSDKSLLLALLEKYKRPWTAKLARRVVHSAQRQSNDIRYNLPQALTTFVHHIPPELAGEFAAGWAVEPKGYWRECINTFLQNLNFRQEIWQSLME